MADRARRIEEARAKTTKAAEHVVSPDLFQCLMAAFDSAFDNEGNFDADKYQRAVEACWKKKHPDRVVAVELLIIMAIVCLIILA